MTTIPDSVLTTPILGALLGDAIGSTREKGHDKSTDFALWSPKSRPTDDSVLTCATAEALLAGIAYDKAYRDWARRYPHAGYGGAFRKWFASDDAGPYQSWGNGSAMRTSPIGVAMTTIDDVMQEAERSAVVTHDHPEGVKGAQSAALAVFLSRTRVPKEDIRREIAARFNYDMVRTIDEIRPGYAFDVSCQGSVPEALIAFLESNSTEEAIRLAISLGGDADTQAAIAGAAAAAWEDSIPEPLARELWKRLPDDMREVVEAFAERYPVR